MAKTDIRIKIDSARMAKAGADIARRAADNAARQVQRKAQRNIVRGGRTHTGAMRKGIVIAEATGNQYYRGRVVRATAPHSAFQEFGTKAHGPVRAKMLRFQIRGKGPIIFAKWVRGVKPLRFMGDAAKSLRASDFVGSGGR